MQTIQNNGNVIGKSEFYGENKNDSPGKAYMGYFRLKKPAFFDIIMLTFIRNTPRTITID